LSQVAREAGVSIATASRAVNGSASRTVRKDLRERVAAAAERLRYVPDANAQAMARGRTTSLGLIVHDIADPYFSSIAAGVTIAAERADLAVTLASTQHDPSREPRFVEVLTRQRALAIVIAGGRRDDSEADKLMSRALDDFRRAGGSVALIGQPLLGVDTVVIENRSGAAALARALHELGYRRFAVLAGPTDHLTARDRCAGFCEALAELGHPVDPDAVITTGFTRDGGYDGMQTLLREGPPRRSSSRSTTSWPSARSPLRVMRAFAYPTTSRSRASTTSSPCVTSPRRSAPSGCRWWMSASRRPSSRSPHRPTSPDLFT